MLGFFRSPLLREHATQSVTHSVEVEICRPSAVLFRLEVVHGGFFLLVRPDLFPLFLLFCRGGEILLLLQPNPLLW